MWQVCYKETELALSQMSKWCRLGSLVSRIMPSSASGLHGGSCGAFPFKVEQNEGLIVLLSHASLEWLFYHILAFPIASISSVRLSCNTTINSLLSSLDIITFGTKIFGHPNAKICCLRVEGLFLCYLYAFSVILGTISWTVALPDELDAWIP